MASVTYQDMIGDLMTLAREIYNRSGALRDAAEGYEKDAFNKIRGLSADIETNLNALETSLSEDRREMHLGGWKNNVITLGNE